MADSVTGYHAANLAVHLACALLLFGTLRRIFAAPVLAPRYSAVARRLAFACSLLWLVYPLTGEVVNYVSQRTESLMAFCYLLTIYGVVRACEP